MVNSRKQFVLDRQSEVDMECKIENRIFGKCRSQARYENCIVIRLPINYVNFSICLGGGDKRILEVKTDFKERAKPKVGSKDNMTYQPGKLEIMLWNICAISAHKAVEYKVTSIKSQLQSSHKQIKIRQHFSCLSFLRLLLIYQVAEMSRYVMNRQIL